MMEEKVAISMAGVEQNRPHFKLGPLNLEVPSGYVTALVGPNGSGKSSTFRLLLDLAKPEKGTVTVLGKRVGGGDDVELKRRIGYLPENTNSFEDSLKAEDKAAFVRQWYPDWDVNYYRELLRLFEIDSSLKLGKMSKGMRRKFELALALAHRPELLLLDEPSSGLDPIAWKKMIGVLHRHMERGDRTILIATHIVEEVRRLADYIVFMDYGRVLGMYEKDELLSSWSVLFVQGEGRPEWLLRTVPGAIRTEEAGGSVRIVTSRAQQAERWCESKGYRIVARKMMELDDILEAMMELEREGVRSS